MAFHQTDAPARGETVAVLHTGKGDISIRLFAELAPRAVENFTTHAKNGYYDGVTFHRVIDGFMIQGGDPEGTGRGGESIWGRPFRDEFSAELHNLRGALSMANAGPNTNGSQFFIVQASRVAPSLLREMESLTDRGFPRAAIEDYASLGGTPHLDFRHTVFGQVFDGMDVVDAIAAVDTDRADKPLEPVVIRSVEIRTAE